MRQQTANNTVGFLLDEEFFVRLHRQLRALIAQHARDPHAAQPVANTYVRIGMWVCHFDTILPAYDGQAQEHLYDVLIELSLRAVKVQVLLWAGSSLPTMNAEQRTNTEMKEWAENPQRPHMEVHLQPYANEWVVRSSNHQKLIIINDNGALEAIAGGFNLGSNYYSKIDHGHPDDNNWKAGNRKWESNLWHDVAVTLTGPSAVSAEQVWVTNWNKPGNAFAQAQTAGNQGAPGPVQVTIATTQRAPGYWWWSSDTYETDIRDLLIAKINGAQDFIYIENYALTDPAIIAALRAKHAAGVKVIVVIHHPKNKQFMANEVWSFLMFFTLIGVSIPRATSFRFNSFENLPVPHPALYGAVQLVVDNQFEGADYTFDAPVVPFLYNSLTAISDFYDARVNYQHRVHADQHGSFRVRDVTDMQAPPVIFAPRRVYDYGGDVGVKTEYPYVHSKVAIIDDRVAFVGSSNWTHRSMVNDGEISAMIENGPAVSAFRLRLFQHWGINVDDPVQWPDNPAAPANGHVGMEALSFNDFLKPTEGRAYTSASSWLGWLAPGIF